MTIKGLQKRRRRGEEIAIGRSSERGGEGKRKEAEARYQQPKRKTRRKGEREGRRESEMDELTSMLRA